MKPDWKSLRDGQTLLGAFLSTGYAANAEILGAAGFDFVIIDLEHGMGSERDILAQLHAIEPSSTAVCVRVESHDPRRVHRILDLGAHGIMFPRVNTATQARDCIAAMRYPPDGVRGVAVNVRATHYGRDFPAYRDASKSSLLTILQIETAEAAANVDEIAAVDGADVLFVGPMDLSTSLGVFRQYDHPRFVEAVSKTTAAARRGKRALGILLPSPDDLPRYRDQGFNFFTCGTDTSFLQSAARAAAAAMREALKAGG